LITIPLQYQQANLLQLSVLNTTGQPAIVVQDRGEVLLINSSKGLRERDFQYGVMPFLASQGINRVDYLVVLGEVDTQKERSLQQMRSQIPISKLVVYGKATKANSNLPIVYNSDIVTDSLKLKAGKNQSLAIQVGNRKWLVGDRSSIKDSADVLVWLGRSLEGERLGDLDLGVAIAKDIEINHSEDRNPAIFYSTKNQGTIYWSPDYGFATALEKANRNNLFW